MSSRRIIAWKAGYRPRFLFTSAIVVLLLLVMRSLWLPLIGGFLIVADPLPPLPADALVPLAGDRSRVIYGAGQFNQGHARWFIVTDMWIGATSLPRTYADSVTRQALQHGVPEERILVAPDMPASTYREALSIRQLARDHGWRSLIIVTSPYHTRRTRMIFGDVFRNTGIDISVQPVKNDWYIANIWWTYAAGRRATGSEYVKLVLYLLGYHQIWKE